jgi:hypothetical protein
MQRRIEIDWALSNMTPKAVPVAPLGLWARQCHADADVDAAAATADPRTTATKKRDIMDPPWFQNKILNGHSLKSRADSRRRAVGFEKGDAVSNASD